MKLNVEKSDIAAAIFGLVSKQLFVQSVLFMLQVGKYHVAKPAEAQNMAEKAVTYIERALEADNENFACHKWSGIVINWSSEFIGTRRKIERSFDVRQHFQVSRLCVCIHGAMSR